MISGLSRPDLGILSGGALRLSKVKADPKFNISLKESLWEPTLATESTVSGGVVLFSIHPCAFHPGEMSGLRPFTHRHRFWHSPAQVECLQMILSSVIHGNSGLLSTDRRPSPGKADHTFSSAGTTKRQVPWVSGGPSWCPAEFEMRKMQLLGVESTIAVLKTLKWRWNAVNQPLTHWQSLRVFFLGSIMSRYRVQPPGRSVHISNACNGPFQSAESRQQSNSLASWIQ